MPPKEGSNPQRQQQQDAQPARTKMVRVVATARGFDGITTREEGEEFDMPDTVFEPRPKRDDKGKVVEGEFYPPPSWFERVNKPARGGPRDGADLA